MTLMAADSPSRGEVSAVRRRRRLERLRQRRVGACSQLVGGWMGWLKGFRDLKGALPHERMRRLISVGIYRFGQRRKQAALTASALQRRSIRGPLHTCSREEHTFSFFLCRVCIVYTSFVFPWQDLLQTLVFVLGAAPVVAD